MKLCVAGGMNLDVTGVVSSSPVTGDSNPGRIRFTPGGVGRNIACRIAGAGHEALLLTALTGDPAGSMLRADCAAQGIDLSLSFEAPGSASSYMALHGPDGDMLLAVNDMECTRFLTPDRVCSRLKQINACDACVIDANLEEETILALARGARVPLIADAVSAHKCRRLLPVMEYLAAIKPNALEAEALTGEKDVRLQAEALLKMGARRVFISLGAKGVFAMDEKVGELHTPPRQHSCSTNGAGDALCAGIAIGAAQNLSAKSCALLGLQMAEDLLLARERAETQGT